MGLVLYSRVSQGGKTKDQTVCLSIGDKTKDSGI